MMSLTKKQIIEAAELRNLLKTKCSKEKKAAACMSHLSRFKNRELDIMHQLEYPTKSQDDAFKATLRDIAESCLAEADFAAEKLTELSPDREEDAREMINQTWERREVSRRVARPSKPLFAESLTHRNETEELDLPDAPEGIFHFLASPIFSDYIATIASATKEETNLVVDSFLVHSEMLAKNPNYRIEDVAYLAWAARRFVNSTTECIYRQKVESCLRKFSGNVTERCPDQRKEFSKQVMRIVRYGWDMPENPPEESSGTKVNTAALSDEIRTATQAASNTIQLQQLALAESQTKLIVEHTKSKGEKDRGKPSPFNEAAEELLSEKWAEARDSGISKSEFVIDYKKLNNANEKTINAAISDFDKMLKRVGMRKARARKEGEK
jgi:hypothetical protein